VPCVADLDAGHRVNPRALIRVRVGDRLIVHFTNLHGFFFQVLDSRGVPVRPLAWKDTVNVPHDESVRILVHFDERPGSWMFHCHILDHADGGLMGTVEGGPGATSHTHRLP
jgi:FtsP/CotA-like multicopper oxidase with cupredoxin domain